MSEETPSKRWVVYLLLAIVSFAVALMSLFAAVVFGSDEARTANLFGGIMLGAVGAGLLFILSSLVSFVRR